MNRLPSVAPAADVSTMSAGDVLELFDWYDFKDPAGHRLTLCQPFRRLVELATAGQERQEDQPPPPPRNGEADG